MTPKLFPQIYDKNHNGQHEHLLKYVQLQNLIYYLLEQITNALFICVQNGLYLTNYTLMSRYQPVQFAIYIFYTKICKNFSPSGRLHPSVP